MTTTFSSRKPRPPARHSWQLLGSQYALSAWVFLIFGVPSLLSALLLIQGEGIGQWWQYLLFIAAAWAAPIAVLILFRLFWLPVRPRQSRPILTLCAFLIAGGVRGVVIYLVEPHLGLQSWSDPTFRLFSEIITIGAAFTIIAIEVSARMSYRDSLIQLAQDREDLLELQMGAAEQFHAQREALLTEAQGILSPILESLKGSLNSARDAKTLALLSQRMRDVVDETVRPLSTSIAQRSPSIERRGRLVPHSRTRTGASDKRFNLGSFVLPFTVTAFMAVMTAAPLFIVGGWVAEVRGLVLMVVGLYVALWLVRLATLRVAVTPRWGTLIYCALHGLAGAVFVLLLDLSRVGISVALLLGWEALLIGIAYLLIRYQYVEWIRADVINTQAEVNAELDVVLSSLRQQVRVESKRIATILHGPVQTALYAAAIRITAQENLGSQLAAEVMTDLENAMSRLESDTNAQPALEEFVNEIASVWGSSVSIGFRQDTQAKVALLENPTALACVTEVVREGVNNAIKHAQATEVDIEIFSVDDRLIDVTVTNRGTLATQLPASGFGADVLNDLTHDWTLTDDGSMTTLWATVALDHVE